MSDDSSRPAKRARHACEGCRRKKTRCPGEQPACSLCLRLGQVCSYVDANGHGADQSVTERLRSLESKMDMMLNGNFLLPPQQLSEGRAAAPERAWPVPPPRPLLPSISSHFPPKRVVDDLIVQYDERCNYQPLPLFHSDFTRTYELRDEELVNSVLAIALRLSPDNATQPGVEPSSKYAARASELVAEKLSNGGIGLATIQALCLISFWEFTSKGSAGSPWIKTLTIPGGQKEHSWLHLDIALWLAKESRLTEEPEWDVDPSELEERRRCAWSLYILGRTCGMRSGLPDFTCRFPGASYPLDRSPEAPAREAELIIANNIRLYDIWEKVQHFAEQSNAEAGKSLWTGDSEYGSIISALMEYESQFPDEHRFSEQTSGAFKDNKAYWAPWFSIQFMYHAILCVLNHPFLLSIRLDPTRESSPRTFRQTTADLAKLHSYWAFRFIGVAKEWDYKVTDPLIAYAVTIAATIFDHYRLSDETQAKRDARDKFTKCVAFVRGAAKTWPIAANMLRLLKNLERSTTGQLQAASDQSSERADILWSLLSYSAVSASCLPPEPSLFSESLLPQHARQPQVLGRVPECHPNVNSGPLFRSRPTSRARETRMQDIQAQITPDSHADSNAPLMPEIRQFEQSLQNTLLDDVLGASFEWWDQGNL